MASACFNHKRNANSIFFLGRRCFAAASVNTNIRCINLPLTPTGTMKHSSYYSSLNRSKKWNNSINDSIVDLRGGDNVNLITNNMSRSDIANNINATTQHRKLTALANDTPPLNRVFIAVGSNLGDRFQNIASSLEMLCDTSWNHGEENDDQTDGTTHLPLIVRLVKTSFLHETAPMYVKDQPSFLNGAVEIETTLSPRRLLHRMKRVEERIGRDLNGGIRNGPRVVDLDIILYSENKGITTKTDSGCCYLPTIIDTPDLIVPHPRLAEREFVLAPLCELGLQSLVHPTLNETIGELYKKLLSKNKIVTDDENGSEEEAVRSIPLPRGRMMNFRETMIMGILNVTPDSFSDGGTLKGSVELALKRTMQMIKDGADIIDIGGESTRPGADEVCIEEEMKRTIPVIERIRQESDVPISIDTRHSVVARAAIEAGADIINDVSGGTYDPMMLSTAHHLRVPVVLMHMRGTPKTMQSLTEYDSVVDDISNDLLGRSKMAENAGIPKWLQILDPGIGFAKDLRGNLLLLQETGRLCSLVGNFPILIGTSRKGFIGKITGETKPEDRDFGSIASCVAAICSSNDKKACFILRVHNVKAMKQAAMVMDAIRKVK